ncbi:unnamed protein product [Lepeophtheirus salmonis]|uniref:(salmon louse) hypothetical protein n=1 Tax=Lepeophtheirus salmonis TaxID=72036 RepID=A0A7R8CTA6_LEPSM|nr:unnamed protein product [Lepeophtheirus salmonis]CAF2921851.1 unnamed protein product [Lepeophtheirus salmonis]
MHGAKSLTDTDDSFPQEYLIEIEKIHQQHCFNESSKGRPIKSWLENHFLTWTRFRLRPSNMNETDLPSHNLKYHMTLKMYILCSQGLCI